MVVAITDKEDKMEQRKATPCPYSRDFIFCQETPCSGCEIYKKWQERWSWVEKKLGFKAGK